MTAIITIALLGGAAWFWADSLRAREIVLARCKMVCNQLQVQLLDQTVALARLGLGRGAGGTLRLRRSYGFEFSIDGEHRHRGQAVLLGEHIEMVRLEYPDGAVFVEPTAPVVQGPWRLQ